MVVGSSAWLLTLDQERELFSSSAASPRREDVVGARAVPTPVQKSAT